MLSTIEKSEKDEHQSGRPEKDTVDVRKRDDHLGNRNAYPRHIRVRSDSKVRKITNKILPIWQQRSLDPVWSTPLYFSTLYTTMFEVKNRS